MNERTRLGLGVAGVALLLGGLADGLLRVGPWGLNFFLWTASLVLMVTLLASRQQVTLKGEARWLVLPTLLFAVFFLWRDSLTLKLLTLLALLMALSLTAIRTRAGRIVAAGVSEYLAGILSTGLHSFLGCFLLLFSDIQWKSVRREGRLGRVLAVGRGLVIALPLLLFFTGLFMAADAVFEGIVRNLLHLDFEKLFSHIFLTLFCAWLVGGFLRGMLLSPEWSSPTDRPQFLWLGMVEVGTVLGLLDLLFLSFVAVQFRYLFGGAPLVAVTPELTYAQYARRGFFELATVAAVSLPVLLLADWSLKKQDGRSNRTFRALVLIQLLLLFVIMASALQRMRLYQSEYGLTELRFYTTAFMGWLALVLIWFAATLLRGYRSHFAFGGFVSGLLVVAVLHLFNPDAFIVRVNAARASSGRSFDACYAASLSADAVPALIEALPSLSPNDRSVVAARLLKLWRPVEDLDWRIWSLARATAKDVVKDNEELLLRLAYHE